MLTTLGRLLSSFTYLGFVISNQCLNLVFCLLLQLLTVVFPGAKTNVLLSIKEEIKMMVQALYTVITNQSKMQNCLLFHHLPSFLDGLLQKFLHYCFLLVMLRHHLVHLGTVGFLHCILILLNTQSVYSQISIYTQHMNLS